MSRNTGGGAGQAPDTTTGGGTTDQASGATDGNQDQASGAQGNQEGQTGQASGSGDQFDLSTITDPAVREYVEGVRKSAEEARNQAARYRTERNQTRDQFQQFQQQHETAEQRADRERQERDQQSTAERERLETLERENRTLRVTGAIQAAATQAFNPALVASMLAERVTLDDQGQPTNVQDLVAGLRQSDPYLFKRTGADAGQGNGDGGSPTPDDMNSIIRGQVAARKGRA